MDQRPLDFRIDYQSPLAKGLVFAGLGRHPKSIRYTDSSLFKNAGALTAMDANSDWLWIPELGRWGLDFDGTDDYVNIPCIVTAEPFTMCCFFSVANVTQEHALVTFGETGGSGSDAYYLSATGNLAGDPCRATVIGGSQAAAATAGQFYANTWTHIAGVYESSSSRTCYKDGTPGSTNTTIRVPEGIVFGTIGGLRRTSLTIPTLGRISDVLVYSRALSSAEIQQLADPSNALLSGLILPPRRKWWPVVSTPATSKVPVFMNHYRNLRVSA